MHKFIKTASLFLAAGVLLLPLSACSGGGGDGFTTLKINEVTHSVFYAPLYLAESLG